MIWLSWKPHDRMLISFLLFPVLSVYKSQLHNLQKGRVQRTDVMIPIITTFEQLCDLFFPLFVCLFQSVYKDDQSRVVCTLGLGGPVLHLREIHPQDWQEDSSDSVQRSVSIFCASQDKWLGLSYSVVNTEINYRLLFSYKAVHVCSGWGDQLIWAQTYEEALYWSRSR